LPIDLLDPDDRTAEALTRFGIHQIHDLLRLPRRDLAARLGPELLTLVARARGEEVEPPLPEPRHFAIEEGIDLEAPIASLEPLAFVFRGLIARLVERLALRSLGCTELRLNLRLENGGQDSRRIGVASPTQDERVLLRLLRLAMEGRPPTAALDGVLITCEGIPLRREQLDLFLPRGPSAQALDQTLAELSSICGTERVGRPEVVDDHRPDAFALRPFTEGLRSERSAAGRPEESTSSRSANPAPARPSLSLRALRPPVRAEVRVVGGRPVFLRSAVSQGEILSAAGPWRTTGYWWSETAHFALDHYDIQMSDGCVLRLCFDWRSKWWQVDGLYD
jgi:protein ImuB